MLLAGALLLLAGASPSSAAERTVAIPGKLFEPERLELLVGDTLTWTNLDAATHTVTADDRSFDSGDLEPDAKFSLTFTRPGRTTYHCEIHRFMVAELEVFALALSGPADPVPVGAPFALRGLAPPGTAALTIERRRSDETFEPVAEAAPEADGRFRAALVATTSGDFRATTEGLASGVVRVRVSPRVTLRARGFGRVARLDARVSPAQPGMPVALEIYARERFTWVRLARSRLDSRSGIQLTLRPRRKLHLRLSLLRTSQEFAPGASNVVVVGGRARARGNSRRVGWR